MSTDLTFTDDGVDVVYEGTEFELEKDLIEEATGKGYRDVTDHEVLQIVAKESPPRRRAGADRRRAVGRRVRAAGSVTDPGGSATDSVSIRYDFTSP